LTVAIARREAPDQSLSGTFAAGHLLGADARRRPPPSGFVSISEEERSQ